MRARAWSLPAALGAALAAGAVGTAMALAVDADRGLDLTDESFYLLGARPWADRSAFTGIFGWYLGPWSRLLGDDVAGLRVTGVVLLALAGAWLGHCAVAAGPLRASWPARLVAVPAAAGAALAQYALFLRTPGSGWFAAVGLLLVAAGAVRLVGEPTGPVWPVAVSLGAGLFVTGVGKVTTGVAATLVVGCAAVVVRAWRRLAAAGALLGALVLAHFALVAGPGDTFAALDRSRQMAAVVDPAHYATANLPAATGHGLLTVLVAGGSPLALLALVPLLTLLPAVPDRMAWATAVPGLVIPAGVLAARWGTAAGPRAAGTVVIVAAGTATVLAACRVVRHRTGRRALAVVLLCDGLALAYPLGSNNDYLFMLTGSAGVLVAGAGIALTASARRWPVDVVLLGFAGVVAALLVVTGARAAVPYRLLPLAQQSVPTAVVPGTPPLLLDPGTAAWTAQLRAGAAAAGWRAGIPLLDLSWHPADVLALDGRAPAVLLPSFPQLPSRGASAQLALSFEDAGRWRDAWLLVPARAGGLPSPDQASAADVAVRVVGRRFPGDYERVVTVGTPFDGQRQTLWRPRDAGALVVRSPDASGGRERARLP